MKMVGGGGPLGADELLQQQATLASHLTAGASSADGHATAALSVIPSIRSSGYRPLFTREGRSESSICLPPFSAEPCDDDRTTHRTT